MDIVVVMTGSSVIAVVGFVGWLVVLVEALVPVAEVLLLLVGEINATKDD
jgi:hypothetical protein